MWNMNRMQCLPQSRMRYSRDKLLLVTVFWRVFKILVWLTKINNYAYITIVRHSTIQFSNPRKLYVKNNHINMSNMHSQTLCLVHIQIATRYRFAIFGISHKEKSEWLNRKIFTGSIILMCWKESVPHIRYFCAHQCLEMSTRHCHKNQKSEPD